MNPRIDCSVWLVGQGVASQSHQAGTIDPAKPQIGRGLELSHAPGRRANGTSSTEAVAEWPVESALGRPFGWPVLFNIQSLACAIGPLGNPNAQVSECVNTTHKPHTTNQYSKRSSTSPQVDLDCTLSSSGVRVASVFVRKGRQVGRGWSAGRIK